MEDINQGMELASHTVGSTGAEKLSIRKKIRTFYPFNKSRVVLVSHVLACVCIVKKNSVRKEKRKVTRITVVILG
jgi:hypothetical protein